jgi:NADH-quinone oxidoreductase subunit A
MVLVGVGPGIGTLAEEIPSPNFRQIRFKFNYNVSDWVFRRFQVTMTALVATLFVFAGVGIAFLIANLTLGQLIRPNRPSPEKGEVYECGEKPIGSAWIQFDLRFYVVALLFVIFDVELVFFFPWAIVFGTATRQANSLDANAPVAHAFAEFAFLELLVFFAVLLVGFAYLWRRGDLEWVKSLISQPHPASTQPGPKLESPS